MDGIGVPSRFACLKIEDDELKPPPPPKIIANNLSKKKSPALIPNQKKNANKGIVATNEKQSSMSLNSKKSRTTANNKKTNKQWEDWKEKDSQLVNNNFEQDLENAIIQSNLEYNANKAKNGFTITTSDNKKGNNASDNNNKKKKARPMSLNQFLDEQKNNNKKTKKDSKDDDDESYFEKLTETAKNEVKREKVEEERKERQSSDDNFIKVSKLQEQLNKEKTKNIDLQKKLNDCKSELGAVKARNKTLCNILGQAEMKEKAELLQELERLYVVKDELTEEVARLHKLLEQERSKTSGQDSSNKKKRKKNG